MKKISLFANIILAVAVVVLYAFYFTDRGRKTVTGSETENEAVVLPSGSIVYIQLDSLMNQMELFHALKNELEAKTKVIDDDLNKKGRAFERDALDFQEKYQKGLITTIQAQTQSAQLENRQRDLQQYVEQKQMELAEEQQVMINRVFYELQTFLEAYNQEHGYALILSSNAATNNVLIGNRSLNITKEIVNGLNDKYILQNKKK